MILSGRLHPTIHCTKQNLDLLKIYDGNKEKHKEEACDFLC